MTLVIGSSLDKPCVCSIPENIWYTASGDFAQYQRQSSSDMRQFPNLPATIKLQYFGRSVGVVVDLYITTPDHETHKLQGTLTPYELVDTVKAGIYVPTDGYLPGLYRWVRLGKYHVLLRIDSDAYREAVFRDKVRKQPVIKKLEAGNEYMSSKGYRGVYIGETIRATFKHLDIDFNNNISYVNCTMEPARIFYSRNRDTFFNRIQLAESLEYDIKVRPVLRQLLGKVLAEDTAVKIRDKVIDNRFAEIYEVRSHLINGGYLHFEHIGASFLLHRNQSITELKEKVEDLGGVKIVVVNMLPLSELPKYLTYESEEVRNVCKKRVDKLTKGRKI